MSRKFQTLKEQYTASPTLTTLIEYLEQCRKENKWDEMKDIVANWNGSETPEVHFYNGIALINLGQKEEGRKELKKVIQINPNHFAAKRELEKIGSDDADAPAELKQTNDSLKKVLMIEPRLEEESRSRTVFLKNAGLLMVGIAVIVLAAYFLFKEDKADRYNDMLKDPSSSFTVMNYSEYAGMVRELKITDIRDEVGDPVKKCILWLTAFAVMDYRLDYENEDTTQLKMFYTLVAEKDEELASMVEYIEGRKPPSGIDLFHKLDKDFPDSVNQINVLKIEIPEKIEKKDLRESFYKTLMLFRKGDYKAASLLAGRILNVFPDHELTQKLSIMIKAASAKKEGIELSDISGDLAVLDKWKTMSIERYYYGEAKILLGEASKNDQIIADGFYSVCPGRKFCKEVVRDFLKRGNTREASRMALFMKEQKENQRDADDIKLVMETSFAETDYSNCYFSFRELAQFFPDSVDDEAQMTGAQCSEKNGYFEEAVAAYEKINEKSPKVEITAKVLRMKYRLSSEEMYFNQLKELSDKNPDNISLLYSYIDALAKKNVISDIVSVLERIYQLETPDRKSEIIGEFLKNGAVAQAVKHLEELKEDKKLRKILIDIYNRYMLFDKADALLAKDEVVDPVWFFLREQIALNVKGEYQIASDNIDKKMESYDKCEPAFLLLKAEIFRNLGDRQRTFGMIDSMLECAPHYLPGLVLAAEITYYQGDLTKAREGISYILENEKYLSPGLPYYHNYLVLLNAEIMVAMGRDSSIMGYLQKNLLKNMEFGPREQDKIGDVSEKLKESMQESLNKYLRRNYKFSAPKTDL